MLIRSSNHFTIDTSLTSDGIVVVVRQLDPDTVQDVSWQSLVFNVISFPSGETICLRRVEFCHSDDDITINLLYD